VLASGLCACLTGPTPLDTDTDGSTTDIDARLIDSGPNDPDARWNDARITPNTHAIHFDAESDHHLRVVDRPTGVDVVDTLTIEAWIYLDSLPATDVRYAIVVKADFNSVDNSYGFEIRNNGGVIYMDARVEGTATGLASNDTRGWNWGALVPEVWYHVAFTYDINEANVADRFHLYIDGSEELVQLPGAGSGSNGAIDSIRNTATPMIIGARIGTGKMINQFNGDIDEVRIWNTVRSPTEIAESYNIELVGDETDLVGYWPLDNHLNDASGRGNVASPIGPTPTFTIHTPF